MEVLPVARGIFFLIFFILVWAGVECDFPTILKLERAFPASQILEIEHLKAKDGVRHGRLLQDGVVNFPLYGSPDPNKDGLYFTRVKLGSPPKEFYVQIDTGSDILWVFCNPCDGCPASSGLGIELQFFDPSTSTSSFLITCSNQICNAAFQSDNECSSQSENSYCRYDFTYGDGSGTSGYYVSDTLYFDTVFGSSSNENSSAPIVFGCSNFQSGDLKRMDRAVNGIFGFGQHELSVVSQLSSRGVTPKVFSHCLGSSDEGGGKIVLGEILEPGIVYTPLVQSQSHYHLNLESISVNGQLLPIDPAVFATSVTRGTIIDSGTTLAYLVEEAYEPFVNAITIATVSQTVLSLISKGNQCFLTRNSVEQVFPWVTLNFQGGASLLLKPQDYLMQQRSIDDSILWCIGWQRPLGQQKSILGDIILKDKIFVYDLERQRIGWTNYNCSLPVSVNSSLSTKNEFHHTGQLSMSGYSHHYIHIMPSLLIFVPVSLFITMSLLLL